MDDDFKRSLRFFLKRLKNTLFNYSYFKCALICPYINLHLSFFFYRDSLESVTTSTVFINCIEITSTVQTLRSKTLQVLWTDANYSSVHKYSFEFWTLQPFRNGKNRQEQFICSHEFWTLQTFKVTKKSQKQFKWSGL